MGCRRGSRTGRYFFSSALAACGPCSCRGNWVSRKYLPDAGWRKGERKVGRVFAAKVAPFLQENSRFPRGPCREGPLLSHWPKSGHVATSGWQRGKKLPRWVYSHHGSPSTGQGLTDRKSTRLNSSHTLASRMPSSA